MSFHEIRFPASLSFGSVGGPERRTEIVALANGFEERNTPWAHSRRRYDAGLGMRSMQDVGDVLAFFEARRGQLHGFRWKDWADYKSASVITALDQEIGIGNGIETLFTLKKTYRSGEQSYVRPIVKPVIGTVRIAVNGVEIAQGSAWDLDETTGDVILATAPEPDGIVTAGYEFDVPVRFDTDRIHISTASFEAGEVPSVPVIEVRI